MAIEYERAKEEGEACGPFKTEKEADDKMHDLYTKLEPREHCLFADGTSFYFTDKDELGRWWVLDSDE